MVPENRALTFFLLINYKYFNCKTSFDQNQLRFLGIRVSIALESMDSGDRLPVFSAVAMLLVSGVALSKFFHCLRSPVSSSSKWGSYKYYLIGLL